MKIWILNHYATNMYFDGTGRHQGLAKYLIRKGHEVKIFCASTVHNSDQIVEIKEGISCEKIGADSVPYVFIKTRKYVGNGRSRILNMMDFAKRLSKVLDAEAKKNGFPDVILASSVHPLTLVAGIRFANRRKIHCICEIRDIWPLSLVEFGLIKNKGLIHKILLKLELWTYKKSESIIFTMKGAAQYINDMGWSKYIPNDKLWYVNNGVDLDRYEGNVKKYFIHDQDLESDNFKIMYTGSIGISDNLYRLVEIAKNVQSKHNSSIQFIVYGDGSERKKLQKYCWDNKIENITFKGRVEKKYIPFILSKSNANIFFLEDFQIYKYGISLNKLFEYFAAGKPIITNIAFGYNEINGYCGYTKEDILTSIEDIYSLSDNSYETMCNNSKKLSIKYSFENLADDIINIIENVVFER